MVLELLIHCLLIRYQNPEALLCEHSLLRIRDHLRYFLDLLWGSYRAVLKPKVTIDIKEE